MSSEATTLSRMNNAVIILQRWRFLNGRPWSLGSCPPWSDQLRVDSCKSLTHACLPNQQLRRRSYYRVARSDSVWQQGHVQPRTQPPTSTVSNLSMAQQLWVDRRTPCSTGRIIHSATRMRKRQQWLITTIWCASSLKLAVISCPMSASSSSQISSLTNLQSKQTTFRTWT